ncbi:plasmalemma vesicle associated protein b [Pseudoliparis swirei]|uniref:plasmalemma vesicle associated protein b n=1 Tax=Pseudoliparis swirei TaxID=2059687 RepID=UPI0024BDA069|nr:plasmalemma vesicle associated protein b [Pseudoliparis swirei]
MYSSSYARAKSAPEAREPPHRPRGKSCGYYMRIVFFFSSLIQSLIIISLVLFLIYGQPEMSAEEKRVQELELNFNRLSEINLQLRKEKAEAAAQLGARSAERAALEAELAKLKVDAGKLEVTFKDKLASCERMSAATVSMMARRPPAAPFQPPPMYTPSVEVKTLQTLIAQQKAMIQLLEANFTQTVQYLSQERDGALRERDAHHHDAIGLRKDNAMLRGRLAAYTRKCKEDFAQSLDGIKTVTSNFLNKINNLFPHQLTFHLTCDRQQDQMEKIRSSCTNLSRDVENKFQLYLDNVGHKVAEIQAKSSMMEVQNSGLTSDLQQCERTHSEAVAEATRQQQLTQTAHDNQVEKLLVEQNQLREQKQQQEERLVQRERELQNLQQTFSAQPNAKPVVPQAPAGASGFRRTPTVR